MCSSDLLVPPDHFIDYVTGKATVGGFDGCICIWDADRAEIPNEKITLAFAKTTGKGMIYIPHEAEKSSAGKEAFGKSYAELAVTLAATRGEWLGRGDSAEIEANEAIVGGAK